MTVLEHSPAVSPEHVLILGGTTDAAQLARAIHGGLGDRVAVITALPARLPPRQAPPGRLKIGSFGGVEGFVRFLSDEGITAVVDATPPFETGISQSAAIACESVRVARIVLQRPPWQPASGDRWYPVDSLNEAARALPAVGRRAFLTTGAGGINVFAGLTDMWFLVRLFTPAAAPLPLRNHVVMVARPPFTVADERHLIETHGIQALVTRQSGGPIDAKLEAAREAGIPVVMVRRPPPPPGEVVPTVEAALAWLSGRL